MYRLQGTGARVARIAAGSHRRAVVAKRIPKMQTRLNSTTPGMPGGPSAKEVKEDIKASSSSNGPLIFAILALAGGAGYYYYTQEPEAQKKEKELERRLEASAENVRNDLKIAVEDARKAGKDVKEHANGLGAKAEHEYERAKASANQTLANTKDTLDKNWDRTKSSTTQHINDAKAYAADTAHKAEEVGEGWYSWMKGWFGYGKKKEKEAEKEVQGVIKALGDGEKEKQTWKEAATKEGKLVQNEFKK